MLHENGSCFKIILNPVNLRRLHVGKHLQLRGFIAADDAGGNSGFNPFSTAGIWNNYAFHVFDNAAADFQNATLRLAAEQRAAFRSGVGNGNGFGTSHGGNQLFPQNLRILLV